MADVSALLLSDENARFPLAGTFVFPPAELDSWSDEGELLSVLEMSTPFSNLEACILVLHFGPVDFAYNPEQTVASECASRLCNSDAVIVMNGIHKTIQRPAHVPVNVCALDDLQINRQCEIARSLSC